MEIIPFEQFVNNKTLKSTIIKPHIKSKINLRKHLKNNPDNFKLRRIKNLIHEIKNHFLTEKKNAIRRAIIPNNNKSLWQSVKIAKNVNIDTLSKQFKQNDIPIEKENVPDAFAKYFVEKINTIVNDTSIDDGVYNGNCKLNVPDDNFMTENDILKAVKSLKIKNCEGHDRIPQRALIDGIELLIKPLSAIFNKIYHSKVIPEQWLITKINPIFKKGNNKF